MNCRLCQNLSSKNSNVSFFRFPSDQNRCREWAERCNILHLFDKYGPTKFYKSFRICSEHFDQKYIVFDGRKKKLLNHAVPNLIKSKEIKETQILSECDQLDIDTKVTQTLLENLCRFCADENTELTDLFGWKGKALGLEEKIKIFPIEVDKSDKLPLKICNPCIVKISKFYDFIQNCMKADARLKTILSIREMNHSNNLMCENHVKNKITEEIVSEDKMIFGGDLIDGYAKNSQKSFDSDIVLFLQNTEDDDIIKQTIPQNLDYKPRKIGDQKCSPETVNLLQVTDNDLSYITTQEQFLLTKSNDVLGKKLSSSSKGTTVSDKYICNICSKGFNALEILESHWKAHSLKPDEHGRFMCQNCKKIFSNKYRLNEHNRIHTGEYPFKCTVCDKKFHKMALLKQHSIVHESLKRFVCSICNLRSSRKGNLIQHLRTHFRDLKNENFKSFPLPMGCIELEKLTIFEIDVHLYGVRTNKLIDKFFRDKTISSDNIQQLKKENDRSEIDVENNLTKFLCGKCQFQCLDLETLKQHIENHPNSIDQNCFSQQRFNTNNERIFNTDYEGSSILKVIKPKINIQRRNSPQQRTYQCEECGVRFRRKDTLTNHMRIHTGERPFVCGSCGFAFKQKGDCLKHERNHQKRDEGDCCGG